MKMKLIAIILLLVSGTGRCLAQESVPTAQTNANERAVNKDGILL